MAFRHTLYSFLFIVPFCASAQKKIAPADYPQDYFRNPLDIPIFLAGNFGECRPGHFHSGMDIKTKGEENQPVHAAADGYVSRIKMEKGGFGHGLYITHPNGYTTLYAHLNDFAPAIQKYVRAQQYEKKRWDVDLQLSPSQFPVKKGDLIASSGNTGASTAPHLHFEIRNTQTEHPLNPELFGFSIEDNLAPVPKEVALYCGHIYSGAPTVLPLKKTGLVYKPAAINKEAGKINKDTVEITNSGIIGIGINVDDFMNGSDNSLTFYTAKLFMDDNIQAKVTLDDIGYDESRYVNAYADYKTKTLQHKWIQCLFQLPGNRLDGIFSQLNNNKGKLDLSDNKTHKIEIIIADDKNNESRISFYVHPAAATTKNTCDTKPLNVQAGKPSNFFDPNISFVIDEKQLYDDINFTFTKDRGDNIFSDKFILQAPYVPLHHYFDLKLKPRKPIPFALRSKIVFKYTDGKDEEGKAAKSEDDGWYKASVRNFGTYWLGMDTIPPMIKTALKNGVNLGKATHITLDVKDTMTSVKSFNGYIDNEWVCFEQHGNSFFYKFDEHCSKGKHQLVFKAEDESGNASTFTLKFIR